MGGCIACRRRAVQPADDDASEDWVPRLLRLALPNEARLVTPGCIYDYLDTPHPEAGLLPVRLVRASWLLRRAEAMRKTMDGTEARRRLALPRRQELPEEAFISAPVLRPTAVVSISYCWFTPEHPDPDGRALLAVADALLQQKAKKDAGNDVRFRYWPEEYGVFLDWCSTHQKDASGVRTPAEQVAFRDALENLDLLYAHAWPTTVMLTNLPVARPYHERGWPTFEYAVSCLVKSMSGAHESCSVWPPAIDVGDQEGRSPSDRAPVDPTRFAELIQPTTFANGRSELDVAIRLYETTVALAFRGAEGLDFNGRKWSQDDVEKFAPLLQVAAGARWLQMNAVPGLRGRGVGALLRVLEDGALPQMLGLSLGDGSLDKDGTRAVVDALRRGRGSLGNLVFLKLGGKDFRDNQLIEVTEAAEAGKLPPLEALVLSGSNFGARGLSKLGGALVRGELPRLDELCMDRCEMDDWDFNALLRLMKQGSVPELRHISISNNTVGGEGLRGLAAKLKDGALPALKSLDVQGLDGPDVEQGVQEVRAARAGLDIIQR